MTMTPRELWMWAWAHRRGLAIIASGMGSIGAAAIGIVFTMWLTVRDHGDVLKSIQEQQTAAVTEQRRYLDRQDAWQTASMQRDLDMTIQLGRINHTLGQLQGKLDRAAMYQGWRVPDAPSPRGAVRQFEGSVS
jgi:hypothetical protein